MGADLSPFGNFYCLTLITVCYFLHVCNYIRRIATYTAELLFQQTPSLTILLPLRTVSCNTWYTYTAELLFQQTPSLTILFQQTPLRTVSCNTWYSWTIISTLHNLLIYKSREAWEQLIDGKITLLCSQANIGHTKLCLYLLHVQGTGVLSVMHSLINWACISSPIIT